MNVVYDLIYLAKERFGGISRMWMEHFRRLPEMGVAPTFLAGPADNLVQSYLEANSWLGGAVVREMPTTQLAAKLRMLGLWRNLQLMRFKIPKGGAIFHSTDYINPLLPRRGLRIVTTIHDMVFWDQANHFDKNIWYWDKCWTTWHSLRVSDAVITVSETSRQAILRRFPWAENKIVVVPHGLDESLLNVALTVEKTPRFLFVGGRNTYKNYNLLVEAFARFRANHPGWELHVVGENAHSKEAEAAKYRQLGIADHVVDHGLVDQPVLIALLESSAALVIPSFNEGFNFPLLEGMAAGTPVLSSDIPASRELGAEHAHYFSPRSVDSLLAAMNALAENPPDATTLATAQAHARKYDWSRSAAAVVAVYERCLNRAVA